MCSILKVPTDLPSLSWPRILHFTASFWKKNQTLVFLFCIISTQPRASWPPTLSPRCSFSSISSPFLFLSQFLLSHCPNILVPGASFGFCQGSVLPWLCLSLPVVWSIAPRPRLSLGLSVLDFRGLSPYLLPSCFLLDIHQRTEFTEQFLTRPLDREASLGSLCCVSVALDQRGNSLSVVLLGECKDSRTTRKASHEF